MDLNVYILKSLTQINRCKGSKGCVLEADLEYPKALRELHNNYPLATDKTEKKKSNYQLKIVGFYDIFYS